jgi:hypothetical protein
MCDTGHSGIGEDVRSALRRLEEAVVRHQRQLAEANDDPADVSLRVLRRSVLLMQQEADRLRRLIDAD